MTGGDLGRVLRSSKKQFSFDPLICSIRPTAWRQPRKKLCEKLGNWLPRANFSTCQRTFWECYLRWRNRGRAYPRPLTESVTLRFEFGKTNMQVLSYHSTVHIWPWYFTLFNSTRHDTYSQSPGLLLWSWSMRFLMMVMESLVRLVSCGLDPIAMHGYSLFSKTWLNTTQANFTVDLVIPTSWTINRLNN